MKQIDLYVDSVYQNIDGHNKEMQDLKSEMKAHLIESVHELMANGKTEQEAIEIAIRRFGGEEEIRWVVDYLYKAQRVFAKWVLVVAMTVLFICGSLLGTVTVKENNMINIENSTFEQIDKILEDKNSLSPDVRKEIKTLIENKINISSVKIINLKNTNEEVFHFEGKSITPKWIYSQYTNVSSNDKWTFYMEIQRFNDFVFISLLSGIAVYWTLFTIWATVTAYHDKRLHIGWILSFALFNILGYLIYAFVGKRFSQNQ